MVLAMCSRSFIQLNPLQPHAFSVFSCVPLQPGVSTGNDSMSFHLKATEGKGLSDADVSKSSKTVHTAPLDDAELGTMLVGFAHVISHCFLDTSDMFAAIVDWTEHIKNHNLLYRNLISADHSFPAKLLARIDHGIQQYLVALRDPLQRRRALSYLAFDQDQWVIENLQFDFRGLPDSIQLIVNRRLQGQNGSSPPGTSGGASRATVPVSNPQVHPSLKVTDERLLRLLKSSIGNPRGLLWGREIPCPAYHSEGYCPRGDACPRRNTHRPPTDSEISSYSTFVSLCRQCLHDRERPGGPRNGRPTDELPPKRGRTPSPPPSILNRPSTQTDKTKKVRVVAPGDTASTNAP